MARVSTPTVSRFESGETDIQLPTVLSILKVLGMIDQRMLTFPEPTEFYDANRGLVSFTGQDGDKVIRCAISTEALQDYFNADHKVRLKVFVANRERIEHAARRKYLAGWLEADGLLFLKTEDMG